MFEAIKKDRFFINIKRMLKDFDFEEYIAQHYEIHRGESRTHIVTECPVCGDNHHLWFDPVKGVGHCKVCDEGISGVRMIMLTEGFSSYSELHQFLARYDDIITLPIDRVKEREEERERALEEQKKMFTSDFLPKQFKPCYDGKVWRIPAYLKNRVSKKVIKLFNFGYCESGKYAERIIIPVKTAGKKTFVARATWKLGKKDNKYLNPLGNMSEFMMNYDEVETRWCFLHEGVFDVLRTSEFNLPSVNIFGTNLSEYQVSLLIKKFDKLFITMDYGVKKSVLLKIGVQLLGLVDVRYCLLSNGDPGDIKKKGTLYRLKNQALSYEELKYSDIL